MCFWLTYVSLLSVPSPPPPPQLLLLLFSSSILACDPLVSIVLFASVNSTHALAFLVYCQTHNNKKLENE